VLLLLLLLLCAPVDGGGCLGDQLQRYEPLQPGMLKAAQRDDRHDGVAAPPWKAWRAIQPSPPGTSCRRPRGPTLDDSPLLVLHVYLPQHGDWLPSSSPSPRLIARRLSECPKLLLYVCPGYLARLTGDGCLPRSPILCCLDVRLEPKTDVVARGVKWMDHGRFLEIEAGGCRGSRSGGGGGGGGCGCGWRRQPWVGGFAPSSPALPVHRCSPEAGPRSRGTGAHRPAQH